jgi:hypothetical protein
LYDVGQTKGDVRKFSPSMQLVSRLICTDTSSPSPFHNLRFPAASAFCTKGHTQVSINTPHANITMQLLNYIYRALDYALALVKLVQNREVGWQTLNRKSGRYEREQQPILKKLKLLLLFNPLTEWIDRTHLLRLWIHEKTVIAGKTGKP